MGDRAPSDALEICARAALISVAAVLVIGLFAPAMALGQADVASRPLSSAERARLAQGRLVTRPTTQSRGSLHLVGGVSYQVINASPDAVWAAMGEPRQWRRMLPQVTESRQVAGEGSERTIYLRQSQGPISKSYYLRATYEESRRELTFVLDTNRPHDLRAAWGFMSVHQYGDGRSLLSYGAMVDIGDGLLASMIRGTMHEWLLRVPSTIKRYVESAIRRRHAVRPEA
ncbi:MAG: SRPBCC family protein [Deltaproteobacteria bacterium]|nr:SRPBCC family protein [Deltaproteobacteria bacterium]